MCGPRSNITSNININSFDMDVGISSKNNMRRINSDRKSFRRFPIVLLYKLYGNIVCQTFFNKSNCRKHCLIILCKSLPNSVIASDKSVLIKQKKYDC